MFACISYGKHEQVTLRTSNHHDFMSGSGIVLKLSGTKPLLKQTLMFFKKKMIYCRYENTCEIRQKKRIMEMKYNTPKRIGFAISEISFGAWQLGNDIDFDKMSENDAIKLVECAVKAGITLYDTAPNYGRGNSERILGKALKPYRHKVFISSKFGHDSEGGTGFEVDKLETSVRNSLKRLETDYLDSLILHNPGREMLYGTHPIYKELKRLKSEGIITHYGVSVDWPEELEIVLHENEVDVIEILFNIVHQSPKKWFDEIGEKGILLMTKVPLDSGWLTGKYTKETVFKGIRSRWTEADIKSRLEIVERIKDIVGKDIIHASLRFILDYPAVTCVIPGIRNQDQLATNIAATGYVMDKITHDRLERLYDDYIRHQNTPW